MGSDVLVQHIYRFSIERDAVRDEDAAGEEEGQEQEPSKRQKRQVEAKGKEGRSEEGHDEVGEERQEEDKGEEDQEQERRSQGYRCRYWGHRNVQTVKQVSYFGPRSEYVVSGSDCGHLFVWRTADGELVSLLDADRRGATNCLEGHPTLPILATSGLEHDAKVRCVCMATVGLEMCERGGCCGIGSCGAPPKRWRSWGH